MTKRKRIKGQTTIYTKDRLTRTQLKSGIVLRCPGIVDSSCSTSCTRRVKLVTYPVIDIDNMKSTFGDILYFHNKQIKLVLRRLYDEPYYFNKVKVDELSLKYKINI